MLLDKLRTGDLLEIFEHIRMPGISKIIGENSICLILVTVAFEAIQCPVCPVNPSFFEVSHQVFPCSIPRIMTKLSQQKRISQRSNKGLVVEYLLLELIVGYQFPGRYWPGVVIEMPRVDQLVLDTVVQRRLVDYSQIQLVVKPSHQDQPVRGFFQSQLSRDLGSSLPISLRVAISPGRSHSICLPQLIPQIYPDDPWVVGISPGQQLSTFKELVLRPFPRPPQPIPIRIGTAPLRGTVVVIEDNHHPRLCDSLYGLVKDLHRSHAYQVRVSLEVLVGHFIVIIEQLQRVGQSDAIHAKPMPDMFSNILKRPTFQPIYTMSAHMPAGPITSCQLDPPICRINDHTTRS